MRGVRTAWRFLKWFAGALRWRLREGGGWTAAPVPAAVCHADPPLGAAIAVCGPRAAAVFAASTRTLAGAATAHADAVLTRTPPLHGTCRCRAGDTHAAAAATAHADAVLGHAAAAGDAPVAALATLPHLAVPAFDPALDNPIGWVREVECRSATLGPGQLLPAGIRADRQVSAADRDALLHCHHLVDVAAFHACATGRAGALARIAAWGVPVRLAEPAPALESTARRRALPPDGCRRGE